MAAYENEIAKGFNINIPCMVIILSIKRNVYLLCLFISYLCHKVYIYLIKTLHQKGVVC